MKKYFLNSEGRVSDKEVAHEMARVEDYHRSKKQVFGLLGPSKERLKRGEEHAMKVGQELDRMAHDYEREIELRLEKGEKIEFKEDFLYRVDDEILRKLDGITEKDIERYGREKKVLESISTILNKSFLQNQTFPAFYDAYVRENEEKFRSKSHQQTMENLGAASNAVNKENRDFTLYGITKPPGSVVMIDKSFRDSSRYLIAKHRKHKDVLVVMGGQMRDELFPRKIYPNFKRRFELSVDLSKDRQQFELCILKKDDWDTLYYDADDLGILVKKLQTEIEKYDWTKDFNR